MSTLIGLFSVLGLIGAPQPLPEGVELPIRVAAAVFVVSVDTINEAESSYTATLDVV